MISRCENMIAWIVAEAIGDCYMSFCCFRLLLVTCNLFHYHFRSSPILSMSPDSHFRGWSDKSMRKRGKERTWFQALASRREIAADIRHNCVLWACNRRQKRSRWKETIFHVARDHPAVTWPRVKSWFLGVWRTDKCYTWYYEHHR